MVSVTQLQEPASVLSTTLVLCANMETFHVQVAVVVMVIAQVLPVLANAHLLILPQPAALRHVV